MVSNIKLEGVVMFGYLEFYNFIKIIVIIILK
jgi:hypothetical protein